MELSRKIIVTLSAVMIVLGMVSVSPGYVSAFEDMQNECVSAESRLGDFFVDKNINESLLNEDTVKNKNDIPLGVKSVSEKIYENDNNTSLLLNNISEEAVETGNNTGLRRSETSRERISEKKHSYKSNKKYADDSFIKNVRFSTERINSNESFQLFIDFSIGNADKMESVYEYQLTESKEITIMGKDQTNQSVYIQKDGVAYGVAILSENKVRLEFFDNLKEEYINISGSVSFSAVIKINEKYKNEPIESIVENIGIGNNKTQITVDNSDYNKENTGGTTGSDEKKEIPFFKTGVMNNDGTINWGLVFNQNIDNVNNFIEITHPVEVYDDVGAQMRIIEDPSRFSMTIHNDNYLEPDYMEMQRTGELNNYNYYMNWLIASGQDRSLINQYMNVPMKRNESIYPIEIKFVEKHDGKIKYLSIVATYSEEFSGNYGFRCGDAEIGRVYFQVPENSIDIIDKLKYRMTRCNESRDLFTGNTSMYVVLYPGFIEGKYVTFNYATEINEKHKDDENFVNKASVNFVERGIKLEDEQSKDGFNAVIKNINNSGDISFDVNKTLPQTGGNGMHGYVASGIFIQAVFLAFRKIIKMAL